MADYSAHLLDADNTVFNANYVKANRIVPPSQLQAIIASNKKVRQQLAAYVKPGSTPLRYSDDHHVVSANKKLIERIANAINQAGQGQIESFSLRQAPIDDEGLAARNNTSLFCQALFSLYLMLREKTKERCKLETYLTWDALTRNPPGETFQTVLSGESNPRVRVRRISSLDTTKISMLYAKIQRIVAENPDKQDIDITVWDDDLPTLQKLQPFFSNNLELIPKKVTLYFMHHKGWDGKFSQYGEPLKGQGKLNPFYEATVRKFYAGEYIASSSHAALVTLHSKALQFQGLPATEILDGNDYTLDMFRSYLLQESRAAISTQKVIDCWQRQEQLPYQVLVEILLQKMITATTSDEVLDIIKTINLPQNRVWLKDNGDWSLTCSFWKGSRTTMTGDDFNELGKNILLKLYAENRLSSFSAADIAYFQAKRRWAQIGNTRSYSLFEDLSRANKKASAQQKINQRYERRCHSIRKRHQIK